MFGFVQSPDNPCTMHILHVTFSTCKLTVTLTPTQTHTKCTVAITHYSIAFMQTNTPLPNHRLPVLTKQATTPFLLLIFLDMKDINAQ